MEYYRTDTQISEPVDSSKFNLTANLNGFGWDPDEGIFIPVESGITYFQAPFNKMVTRTMPNG